MGSPLPPDPYAALGVERDATTTTIRTAHRKLVLKCHPDKVTDPAAKQAASDQFHLIQSAYEILVDEDRRGRYDAQVRLAELRREKMERQGGRTAQGYDARPAASAYRPSYEPAPRSPAYPRSAEQFVPQYEVRQPPADYFESQARSTVRRERRDYDHERPTRRPSHDVKNGSRPYVKEKEAARADRREKDRRTDREIHRDRDRKSSYVDPVSDSDSDEYARRARKTREAEDLRRARDLYDQQTKRQQEEAYHGYYADERTRKMFAQGASARDYIQSSRSRQRADTDRRASPVRESISRDHNLYVKQGERPAGLARETSSRSQPYGRDTEPPPRRQERRSSAEYVDQQPRQPPPFVSSKSSPVDIRIPTDKPRAHSLQVESDVPDIPRVKRAETMPYRRSENTVPTRSSTLRTTEIHDGMPSPGVTPEYNGPSRRHHADDEAFIERDASNPVQDSKYRTEYREPVTASRPSFTRKVTRSPSPVREPRDRDTREKSRTASVRYDAPSRPSLQQMRQSSKSYIYTPGLPVTESYDRQRPSTSRVRDADRGLFGEIRPDFRPDIRPSTDSPRHQQSPFPAPDQGDYRTKDVRPTVAKTASGYGHSRRTSNMDRPRPNMSRSTSQAIYGRA